MKDKANEKPKNDLIYWIVELRIMLEKTSSHICWSTFVETYPNMKSSARLLWEHEDHWFQRWLKQKTCETFYFNIGHHLIPRSSQ